MTDVRAKLLRVRESREQRAARALVGLRAACNEADARVKRERRRLEDWRVQAEEEEASLYAKLIGNAVSPRAMAAKLAKVEALRQRTREHWRSLEEAQRAADAAELALRSGQEARLQAIKATQKCLEAINLELKERVMAEERKLDAELDEVAVLQHRREVA
ncbi:type III secretion system stalk subunit SctO [Bordetella genomosp. 9]|uniref:Type III secretion protein n=1 Tax=Bordetella genomosp. 9 TaxID=1416803 RepID=A0A1W6YXM9_9BORD|nr:YscO family type III secretion system apparatus protein [Bordetella genomosp. 9]ARP85659.1 hypothetical protein CAL13_05120 [Bordetella genomosp. 9]